MSPASARDLSWTAAAERAWAALLAVAEKRHPTPLDFGAFFGLDGDRRLVAVAAASAAALLRWRPPQGWVAAPQAPAVAAALLDLYLPVVNASSAAPLVVGHLGQSLDGYIATRTGDSDYVTGPGNILHLHRMRALCDAVLVGAETVASDDPSLTARHAGGRNPVRVIIDPTRRLDPSLGVFTDGAAPTWIVCDESHVNRNDATVFEVIGIPSGTHGLDLVALLRALRARALDTVFVEGGGKTVSSFFEQGLLDRLQIAIAPIVMGRGRPGLQLPAKTRIDECPRLDARYFVMGDDVLCDCDLRADGSVAPGDRLRRVG